MNIELIILAAVAVLVISRLYSVLGQKTGAEQPVNRFSEAVARAADVEDDAEPAARGAGGLYRSCRCRAGNHRGDRSRFFARGFHARRPRPTS